MSLAINRKDANMMLNEPCFQTWVVVGLANSLVLLVTIAQAPIRQRIVQVNHFHNAHLKLGDIIINKCQRKKRSASFVKCSVV